VLELNMDQQLFDDLKSALDAEGPAAAIDRLCSRLRERKDYTNLFYALLLKKRFELGVSPVPTGASQDLPSEMHAPYEDAIRDAGRLAGSLYLEEDNIANAWAFFRMLGETEPVARALERYQPKEGEDCQQLVEIAFHQGVNPRRGFDLILERYGICSAITILGGQESPHGPEVRDYCIKRLVRALYRELKERLAAEITQKQGFEPTGKTVHDLLQGRDWLFADDFYHIDVSHLSSVVQMATQLGPCEELDLARQLCEYGQHLSPRFQYASDPPFEDQYRDYGVYLAILAGDQVEEGLAHFRAKAEEADPETVGTYPAEVLVNLLLRLERPAEALAVARRHLATADENRLTCPNIVELCQRTKDYDTLAQIAREQNNPVHYMAGLIAARN
jgi:hypothetical protein